MTPRHRRATSLTGALGVTVLAALLPGTGYIWSGRRVGYALLLATLAVAGATFFYLRDLDASLSLAFDPARLRVAAVVVAVVLLFWLASVATTYAWVRPHAMAPWQRGVGATLVALVCLGVAAPAALGARYALVQADLVTHVFENNETATAPADVSVEDPWGGRDRVSVLLLGGDGSVTRDGIRTDTLILMTMDTHTGETVMFSLPRNLANAQFPTGSALHALYPDGFRGDGDPAAWMLNAVYGQVPALHPGVLGRSTNEGADAVKQAVSGTLGVPVDYYALVNLDGFKQIVEAMGGVTVDINEPVAIHGDTDRGIPPVGYLEPGPDQRLNGFEALWFARGRWGSSDYDRMIRQRCLVKALVDEARPLNLLRRYRDLAAAGKEIVRTDIPSDLLPAFVDLALRIKDADVRSVAFVSSERFFPGDPDFAWLQQRVEKALSPPPPRPRGEFEPSPPGIEADPGGDADPGRAVDLSTSCEYDPVG